MATSCREYIKRLEQENKVLRQQVTRISEEKELLKQQITRDREERKQILRTVKNSPNSICDLH